MFEDHVLSDVAIAPPESLVRPFPAADEPRAPPMPLTAIRTALAGAMVETYYQPVVRLADRGLVGLEALARLNHPARGTVLPEDFVPQLEDAGLAGQLADLVVAHAFADMIGAALAPLALSVSINFPPDVLVGTGALARLDSQRCAAGIPAGCVIVELTESQPVRDLAVLRDAVERLRGAGYQIMIDDVGPAVAGLDQLLDLPFTGVKLDKGLVHRVTSAPDAVVEVERIVGIARRRDLTVVAEGVETAAEWCRLAALGVDQAQGFLVAHPLQAAAVPMWLASWRQAPAF